MEENTNIMTEQAEQTSDSFLEGWDDSEVYAPDEADQPEAEQQTEAEAEEAPGTEVPEAEAKPEPTEQPAADAPRTWTLRHLEETRTVNEADMVVLAQKGMDYDRIRTGYDEAKPVMDLFRQFAQQAYMSVGEYVAYIRTQAKQATGMNEAEAKRSVELEDREAAVAAQEEAQNAQRSAEAAAEAEKSRRTADIEEFRKLYPDAAKDPGSIPPEVWQKVNEGASLVVAYAMHREKEAQQALAAERQKAAAAEQNRANAARSTGSMQTAGDTSKGRDPFLEGWGD